MDTLSAHATRFRPGEEVDSEEGEVFGDRPAEDVEDATGLDEQANDRRADEESRGEREEQETRGEEKTVDRSGDFVVTA